MKSSASRPLLLVAASAALLLQLSRGADPKTSADVLMEKAQATASQSGRNLFIVFDASW
jgi:hypothetical protein